MTGLAAELLSGRHLPPDRARAERLLQAAAESGDAAAQFSLGVFYCQRNAAPEDVSLGLRHYVAAAEAGHLLAQYNAGVMYLNGVGTTADLETAAHFLGAAAAQGLPNAIRLFEDLNLSAVPLR
jgi:TPR repeat protein